MGTNRSKSEADAKERQRVAEVSMSDSGHKGFVIKYGIGEVRSRVRGRYFRLYEKRMYGFRKTSIPKYTGARSASYGSEQGREVHSQSRLGAGVLGRLVPVGRLFVNRDLRNGSLAA